MDDERLKNLGGGNYWKELLDRIRDIRSSEKVMYRQVLDLYATSVDYDPKSAESVAFFKMVQNKLHYAAHGHTAAEVIFERADAEKPFMGLTAFSGDFPTAKDIAIAKNYLSADELKILNNLVSGYFDFAEIQAMRRRPMYMNDYVENLDRILASTGEACSPTGEPSVTRRRWRRQRRNTGNIRRRIFLPWRRNICRPFAALRRRQKRAKNADSAMPSQRSYPF